MLIIAWVISAGGWCIVDMCATEQVLAGPYSGHAEAVEAAKTRGWRIAQGWAP